MRASVADYQTPSFEALPPPKVQIKFPSRRRSIRPKVTSRSGHKVDQYTLTQYDFASTPVPSGRGYESSSGDEDLAEPAPKRRRKRERHEERNKTKAQKTLTQVEHGRFSRVPKQEHTGYGSQSSYGDSDIGQIDNDAAQESSEDAARSDTEDDLSQSARYEARTAKQNDIPGKRRESNRCRTPKKARPSEIPSSQTPPSTTRSVRPRTHMNDFTSSPLKGKRRTGQHGAESLLDEVRDLDGVGLATRGPRSESNNNLGPSHPHPIDLADPRLSTTVQPHGVISTSDSSGSPQLETRINIRSNGTTCSTRRTKKTSVVNDSQNEESDLELCADSNPKQQQASTNSESQQNHESVFPETYDPAHDALARDEDRYDRSLEQSTVETSALRDHGDLTDGEHDLDFGCTAARRDVPVSRATENGLQSSSQTGADLCKTFSIATDQLAWPSSPPKSCTWHSLGIPSSPLPLPPSVSLLESSPQVAGTTHGHVASQMSATIDFSLPPPPPLRSSGVPVARK